jgi:hypothetical protein
MDFYLPSIRMRIEATVLDASAGGEILICAADLIVLSTVFALKLLSKQMGGGPTTAS